MSRENGLEERKREGKKVEETDAIGYCSSPAKR